MPAIDPWKSFASTPTRSASHAKEIVPSDTDDMDYVCEFLLVSVYGGGCGEVELLPLESSNSIQIPISGHATIIPIRTRRVLKSGTTPAYRVNQDGTAAMQLRIIGCW